MSGLLHCTGSRVPGSVSPIGLFILENLLAFLKKGGCTFPEIRCFTTFAKQFCFSGQLFNGGRCSQSFQRFFYGDGALLCNCVCHGTCGGYELFTRIDLTAPSSVFRFICRERSASPHT